MCFLSVCIFLWWLNQISWLTASKMRRNSPVPILLQLRQHLLLRGIWSPRLSNKELGPAGPSGSVMSHLKSPVLLFVKVWPWVRCSKAWVTARNPEFLSQSGQAQATEVPRYCACTKDLGSPEWHSLHTHLSHSWPCLPTPGGSPGYS
jgi:hypothetical protein